MSTSAKSLAPLATRAIASGDPLAISVVTARPSWPNRPSDAATMKGAAPASIGRSRVNWIAIGGRFHPRPGSRRAEAGKTRQAHQQSQNAADGRCRSYAHEDHNRKARASCRAGYVCFMAPERPAGNTVLDRILTSRMTVTVDLPSRADGRPRSRPTGSVGVFAARIFFEIAASGNRPLTRWPPVSINFGG